MLQHKTVILELFAAVCSKWYSRRFKRAEKPAITRLFSSLCSYSYDSCNRLSKLTCGTGNDTWETVYTYDNDGKAKTVTLQNGKVLTNTYDSLGRLQYRDIGLTANSRTELTYLAGADANSTTALLESYKNGSDDAYTYAYDANGNITSVTQGSTAVTYTYNAANELIREDNGFTNETVTYRYDPWGNMLEKVTYAYGTATPVKTVTYSYGNPDWQDELTGISTVTGADTVNEQIVYDANGNAVSYRGATLAWNGKQLTSWTKGSDSISYAYDANGLRSRKTVNGTATEYYYNGSVLMSLVTGDDTLLFSYDQGGNVISVNHNGTDYYYLRNEQNDVVALIDDTGAKVTEYVYNSWGEVISLTGPAASTIGTLNPFRCRGYVYDEETGLYYLQSRYYDPEVCRFISSDVLLSTGQGVLGHNSFAYCLNKAVTMVDSKGKDAIWIQEGDSAGGFGHSGLMVQDENDKWWYYYWGPKEEVPSFQMVIPGVTNGFYFEMVEISEDDDLSTTEGVIAALTNKPEKQGERSSKITATYYLKGDYTATHKYLKDDRQLREWGYNLLSNNCVQQTIIALSKSNRRVFSLAAAGVPIIPNIVAVKLELLHRFIENGNR